MNRRLKGSIEVLSGRPSAIAEAIEELRYLFPVSEIEHINNTDGSVTVNAYAVGTKTIIGLSKFFFDKESNELQGALSALFPGKANPPSVIYVESEKTGTWVEFTADVVAKDGEDNIEFWAFRPSTDLLSLEFATDIKKRLLELQLRIFND